MDISKEILEQLTAMFVATKPGILCQNGKFI